MADDERNGPRNGAHPDAPASTPRSGRRRGRRRKPLGRRRRVLRTAAWSAAAATVLGGTGLGIAYARLDENITAVDLDAKLGGHRPVDTPDGSMDILLLGSDSRTGANGAYGRTPQPGARSDTAMVLHIDKRHDEASVVSIPRDTVVERPACTGDDGGGEVPARRAMFNSAYQVGGPACTVKTVESMSGIRMDHYAEVDFTGFKKLIDDLGGVEITTKQPISDPDSRLELPAGRHELDGEQSLGLVRTRHGVGDGSDLGRIRLQQAFVKALVKQAGSVGTFSSPRKLYDLADSATSAVTTDTGLDSVRDLAGLASLLKGVEPDRIRMSTLPVTYDPADPDRVVPLESKAARVWAALKRDAAIPESAEKGTAGGGAGAANVVG